MATKIAENLNRIANEKGLKLSVITPEKLMIDNDELANYVFKTQILEVLKEVVKPGDVVLWKASNGMKFYELAERMISLWKKKD